MPIHGKNWLLKSERKWFSTREKVKEYLGESGYEHAIKNRDLTQIKFEATEFPEEEDPDTDPDNVS